MSKVAHTEFGTGRVVDESRDRMGRVSYKVQGDGWETWVGEASLVEASNPFPLDIDRPTTVDYENSTRLPYNPRPQYPSNIFVQPVGDLGINPDERLHPADSVTFEDRADSGLPGPAPHLFATAASGDGFIPDDVIPEDLGLPSEPNPDPGYWHDEETYVPDGHRHAFAAIPEEIDRDSVIARLRRDPVRFAQELRHDHHYASEPVEETVARYYEASVADEELRTAAWKDVRAKALRLRRDAQVEPIGVTPESIYAYVQGDHDIYETIVVRGGAFTGANSITEWDCTCKWGQWAFQRQHTFVGRLCSHAYAAYLEMQSQHQKKDKGRDWYASKSVTARASDALAEAAQANGWEVDHSTDWSGMITGSTFRKDGLIIGIQFGGVLDGGIKRATLCEQDPLGWAGSAVAPETTDVATVMGWLGGRTASKTVQAEDGMGDPNGGAVPTMDGDPLGYQYEPSQMMNENSELLARRQEPHPQGLLTTEPGSLTPDEHFIPETHDRWREPVNGDTGYVGVPNGFGLQAAIIDLERVSDPEDQALLDRLRALSEEGNRPQHNQERNQEIRRIVRDLHDRGYNAENITASLDAQEAALDKAAHGLVTPTEFLPHEPFNGSGAVEAPMYETSESYVEREERPRHQRLAEVEQGEELPGDHGFRAASLDDIKSFGDADPLGGSAGSGGGIQRAGARAGVDENDPAMAMFSTVEMSERTATAPGSVSEDPLAYLLEVGSGSSHTASDDGDPLAHLAPPGMDRTAGRAYSFQEQQALINEASADGAPLDQSLLDLSNTHYLA